MSLDYKINSGFSQRRASKETLDIDPMLVYSWASVEDGGLTVKQHWFNVTCLLRFLPYSYEIWATVIYRQK